MSRVAIKGSGLCQGLRQEKPKYEPNWFESFITAVITRQRHIKKKKILACDSVFLKMWEESLHLILTKKKKGGGRGEGKKGKKEKKKEKEDLSNIIIPFCR